VGLDSLEVIYLAFFFSLSFSFAGLASAFAVVEGWATTRLTWATATWVKFRSDNEPKRDR
jgi:hypothetical protein